MTAPDIKALLIGRLTATDNQRPRTQQTTAGPSSAGGCRRQVWYRANGYPEVNPTKRLPSIMGTAMHAAIEAAFDGEATEITVPGIPGVVADAHIDLYLPPHIIDWKSTTKKNLRYFPKQSQIWQVSIYGYLALRHGLEVETTSLVAIPRDGTEDDIVVHTQPYDEAAALQGLAWLRDVNQSESVPPADNDGKICTDYCSFYSADFCLGKKADLARTISHLTQKEAVNG